MLLMFRSRSPVAASQTGPGVDGDGGAFPRCLSFVALSAVILSIAFLSAFHVMDRDFWWHVRAGSIMRETGAIIRTEPFAHTREGQPYLATYEWLAQVVLSKVFDVTGPNGIIVFRMLMVTLAFLALLAIHPRGVWPNAAIAVLGARAGLIGFLERPQLFTFLLLSLFLLLATTFLRSHSPSAKRAILLSFLLLEILWVNLHGAAAILGVIVVSALFFQALCEWWRYPDSQRWRGDFRLLTFAMLLVSAALFASPNGLHVFTYLWDLLHDRTIAFIYEWQPRPTTVYVRELGIFWILALAALALTRKHAVFAIIVLAATGYLSLRAVRHEMLFIFAAVGVTIYELRYNAWCRDFLESVRRHRIIASSATLIAILLLLTAVETRARAFTVRDQTRGFGVFDLARGAYEFIEREGIRGNMFNTYGIGGYLLYRGYPRRQVYIDGRNVDYGYAFMEDTFLAGKDPKKWREIEERYGITYALVDYDAIKREKDIPYTDHLGKNAAWTLVFLDDWVAVYVKNIPAHRDIIARFAFRAVTPEYLEFGALPSRRGLAATDRSGLPGDGFDTLTINGGRALREELRRVASANVKGVKGNLALAKLLLGDGDIAEAKRLLEEARVRQPRRPEVLALTAALHVQRQEWEEAAQAYRLMLAHAGGAYPDIQLSFIADAFEKAGHPWRGRWYRLRDAVRKGKQFSATTPASPPASAPSEPVEWDADQPLPAVSSGTSISVNPEEDARAFNDEAVDHARAGRFTEAKKALDAALKLNPGYAEAWSNLGSVFFEEGRMEEAQERYEKALELAPDFGDAHLNLGSVLLKLGRFKEAMEHARRAGELGKDADALIREIQTRLP